MVCKKMILRPKNKLLRHQAQTLSELLNKDLEE